MNTWYVLIQVVGESSGGVGRGAWGVGHGAWSVVGCGGGSVLEISRSKWHLTGSQALAR